jgi:RimJ/RimL family protein N-acetyltransferase
VVSIYLVPGKSGHGYGARLLLAGHEWLRRHRPDIEAIVADVLPENRASAEAFRQAGYALDAGQFLARIR